MMDERKRLSRIAAALATLLMLASACTGRGSSSTAFRPHLSWGTCPSDVEIQFLSRHRCGWLTVLQDRAKPTGATVRLLLVQAWPVGIAPLPGLGSGFGGNLGQENSYGSNSAGATRLRRVGIGMELRGTGHSLPSLACPEVSALDGREAGTPTGDPQLLNEFISAVKACRQRLVSNGVDPADYDLQNVARDEEDLRVAMGVDRWATLNSYGTSSRYLFEYLREFPSRVRAAYVDSPQFPGIDEITSGVEGTRDALSEVFKACGADKRCAKAYPNLPNAWARAVDRLEHQPVEEGASAVDAGTLLRAMRFALGGDGPDQMGLNLTMLPAVISAAAQGRISPELAATMDDVPLYCPGYRPVCIGEGDEGFSLGSYLTVLCRDEVPFIDRADLSALVRSGPAFAEVFSHPPYLAACKVWDVPPATPAVHKPVHTDVPLLMLPGQFDSFSPASEARAVASTLPRAWVVEVPGQTHNTLGFSDCPISIRNAWVQDPTSAPADTSCLGALGVRFSTRPQQGGGP
jgi:pimeloyl-ACP methyl ester carboxylesterase